jgi:glutamine synthetase
MENCRELRKYLSPKFITGYIAVKRAEQENYHRVISSWEREFLMLSV